MVLIDISQSMLLPIYEDKGTANDAIIKTISTRIAGGRRELNKEPSRVCVPFLIAVLAHDERL